MLFAMAALMLLLLPTLLLVLSPQKSTALALSVAGPGDIPNLPPGPIESLLVETHTEGFTVTANIRTTDVLASQGDVEQQTWQIKDLSGLQQRLRALKKFDPQRKRIQIQPAAQTLTEDVVLWMDILRKDSEGELFPEIIISRESK